MVKIKNYTPTSGKESTEKFQGGNNMVVQTNMRAQNANRSLNITMQAQSKSSEKLTTGYKINRAADDASGLTISEKMRRQIRGLDQASANAQDGISLVQVAEGALTEVHAMLQRMNELAIKAANGTNTAADRIAINTEVSALRTEISRISQSTEFNSVVLLTGAFKMGLQVGTENRTEQRISVKICNMGATALGVGKGADGITLSTISGAQSAISAIKTAISKVSVQRSYLGAIQNRLEYAIRNLDNTQENTTAAESNIRDTNMAEEMVSYSNNNILAQAGQSMLAQANQSNQGVLSLLG